MERLIEDGITLINFTPTEVIGLPDTEELVIDLVNGSITLFQNRFESLPLFDILIAAHGLVSRGGKVRFAPRDNKRFA